MHGTLGYERCVSKLKNQLKKKKISNLTAVFVSNYVLMVNYVLNFDTFDS